MSNPQFDDECRKAAGEPTLDAKDQRIKELEEALKELVECIESYDEDDLLALDSDPHSPSWINAMSDKAKATLERKSS